MDYEITEKTAIPESPVDLEAQQLFDILKELPMNKAARFDFWRYSECCQTRYEIYGIAHAVRLSGEKFALRTRVEVDDLPADKLAEWEADPLKGLRARGHHLWVWKEKKGSY